MPLPGQRYVSSELSHFVGRGRQPEEQYLLLLKILNEGWISHPPHMPNISGNLTVTGSTSFSSNEMYAPEVVCFCDIPIADLGIHAKNTAPLDYPLLKTLLYDKEVAPFFIFHSKPMLDALIKMLHPKNSSNR